MASSSNGNGNLMDEFEEAFQACLHALTKQEANSSTAKDEMELEVQQTANKFIDVARQMEAFLLQKRFLISTLKPEILLKDENVELKMEIQRKDTLINKHYSRLEEWKSLLSDSQQQSYNKSVPHNTDIRTAPNYGNLSAAVSSNVSAMGMMNSNLSSSMQSQLQQQQMQQAQQHQHQQQQHMLQQQQQQQQLTSMQHMQVNAQQMYMQQGPGAIPNRAGSFNQGGNMLQGPLAYLEKTTSNIDMVGMSDGRR